MTSRPKFRAWRFLHPDFDPGPVGHGLQIAPTGAIEMVEEQASVRQAILMLLTTRPGERVMRPEYGCDLASLVFSPNDQTTAGLAIHYVRRALERWEPRIDILKLDALANDDAPDRLDVILEYRVRSIQRDNRIEVPLELSRVS